MERRSLLSLQHGGHGAAPAVRGRRGGDLREHGIADPGLGGDPLHRDDFRETLGARDPHLVVLGVVEDEWPSLHAPQQQGWPRDAGPERRRRDHRRVGVVQQRQTAAQAAVEQQIGLGLRSEPQVGGERRVPVRPHVVPQGEVIARLGPRRRDGAFVRVGGGGGGDFLLGRGGAGGGPPLGFSAPRGGHAGGEGGGGGGGPTWGGGGGGCGGVPPPPRAGPGGPPPPPPTP